METTKPTDFLDLTIYSNKIFKDTATLIPGTFILCICKYICLFIYIYIYIPNPCTAHLAGAVEYASYTSADGKDSSLTNVQDMTLNCI